MGKNANISMPGRLLYVITMVIVLLVTSYRPTMQADLPSGHLMTEMTGQDDSDRPEHNVLDTAYEAILPIYKIQLTFFCSFVTEYQLIEEIELTMGEEVPPLLTSYFKILFRTFISPNAP
jgi:hypothetical protein